MMALNRKPASAGVMVIAALLLSGVAPAALAESAGATYSPYANQTFPRAVLWGNTHLHTSYSVDAYTAGNTTLGPETAYRFARGERVTASNGMAVKLIRPLDFLVVTDHAELLGVLAENPQLARKLLSSLSQGKESQLSETELADLLNNRDQDPSVRDRIKKLMESAWTKTCATADQMNEPGKFTAFIGYEYTSMPKGNNLHRNVVFRDAAKIACQTQPFSAADSTRPEDLWAYMANYEKTTGGHVLAIPHNPNLSNGLMFADTDSDGNPLTRAYAETRSYWEPLAEAAQVKGDSETHPLLSPGDEFADYEIWDAYNLGGTAKTTPQMLPTSYIRSALKFGLQYQAKLGVNPFKFGLVGASDAHTGLVTTREDNFFGDDARVEPSPDRWKDTALVTVPGGQTVYEAWKYSASGLGGVWATSNTREAIFDAMRRRETYATTGSRMVVRLFGGWTFTQADVNSPDYVDIGYAKGVPMGADLTAAPKTTAPTFMAVASRDPDNGANLDRIQIVKGWLDAKGSLQEKVYNIALSDGRVVGPDGKVRPLKSTVDVATATYTNTIGASTLAAAWTDPDFDPAERAFYYARVIEIPTPRWTAYDAVRFKVTMSKDVTMEGQERAYTSPIWYTPAK